VDDEGKMLPSVELVAGLWFKDADRPIVRDLERRGLLVSSGTYRHSYPFNWRGSDPLMYVARSAWYIRTTNIKERLVALNREITWVPEHIRDGRFGDWLENNVDWALSRERFWGTPLPIWVSDKDPEHCEVVGSVAELAKKAGRDLSGLDLHRPFVDEITWPDGRGGTMKRVPEVVDVWFDSGAMPFAQWHYPFANRAQAEAQFPADFICEGLDQTRGWFYSLHAISALVKDSCAYRACFVTGLLVGEDGQKMSKSLGNTVDPWEAVSIGGADSLRWFLVAANNPSGTMRFSRDGLREVSRKVLDTLKNLYLFFAQYANLDGYRPDVSNVPLAERSLLDRWVLSRLDSLVALCRESLDRFEISRAGRAISEFVIEDLSNWYVRRSRERFWAEGFEKDKRSAYDTLYECLVTVVRLAAPFIPFLTERIYLALNSGIDGREESVHLASYPEGSPSRIDRDLERRMENVRLVVRLGRAARNRANVKVRQPLARVKIVPAAGEEGLGALTEVALEELNVKEAAYGAPGSALAELSAKARFDVLGPRFGKDVKAIAQAIGALSTDRIVELESSGSLGIDTTAGRQEIRREEVQVVHEDPEGWVMERERGWSVALDLAIDDDLRDEGFAREIVNKIQFMRRKAGFAITDRIEVYFQGTEPLKRALETHGELIRHETQADELRSGGEEPAERESWDINGEPAVIGVRRVGSGQVLER
jgi:isoleucyl-tRNA synthetase